MHRFLISRRDLNFMSRRAWSECVGIATRSRTGLWGGIRRNLKLRFALPRLLVMARRGVCSGDIELFFWDYYLESIASIAICRRRRRPGSFKGNRFISASRIIYVISQRVNFHCINRTKWNFMVVFVYALFFYTYQISAKLRRFYTYIASQSSVCFALDIFIKEFFDLHSF